MRSCRQGCCRAKLDFSGQRIAAGVDVVGAVQKQPGFSAIHRAQDSRARRVGVSVAGGGEDDRLIGIVIASENRDRADAQAGGRAVVGQRIIRRAAGVVGEEVGGLPHAAVAAGNVNRIAAGIGWIDGDAGDFAGAALCGGGRIDIVGR